MALEVCLASHVSPRRALMHGCCQHKLSLQAGAGAILPGFGGCMPGRMVEFRVRDRSASGYLAMPSGHGPGVIVTQDWWGLGDHIKAVADRFAAEGFIALAPDLYHGEKTTSRDQAARLMMALSIEEAERDLAGAVNGLLEESGPELPKVGIVGFGMGGALSLHAACRNRAIGACVSFYGFHPNVHPDLTDIRVPVLALYAERDTLIPPARARDLEQRMRALRKSVEIHFYPADHAFFDDTRKETHNADAARDGWHRTLEFLRRHLG
jgi:carboxymethylenebutenolidase